jgi:pyruvate dehydrogenase E2 component (dihydrolipoamide acetyltransferase)
MATKVAMPLLSPTMTEGRISKWNKKEGDTVKAGESLAEVETDKAILDMEAYESGTLLKIVAPADTSVAIGALVAILGKPGEDISALLGGDAKPAAAAPAAAPAPKAEAKPAQAPAAKPAAAPVQAAKPAQAPKAEPKPAPAPKAEPEKKAEPQGRVKSSPLARKIASAGGLEISQVQGSGPGGRVIARDVEAALQAKPAAVQAEVQVADTATVVQMGEGEQLVPISGMRRVIAERLQQAKREVPHFYLTVDIDMEKVVALRAELKEAGVQASINDFIIKACASALVKLPAANRSWSSEGFVQHNHADIGVAVAIEDGLLTPVIRDAARKSVGAIAAEIKEMAERARSRKLKPEEYQGGSMSVSNLGMFGVDSFSAVINPPQSCILAVGAMTERPAAVGGQLVIRKRMTVTLSCDHRTIDGALGAKLLAEIKGGLEKPLLLGF